MDQLQRPELVKREYNLYVSVFTQVPTMLNNSRDEPSMSSYMLTDGNGSGDDLLNRQLERLWTTDFNESTADTKSSLSVDRR